MNRCVWLWVIAAASCANHSAAPAAPAAQSASATRGGAARDGLSAEASVVHRRLLGRDGAPSCAALIEGVSRPASALIEVAERAQHPPSAAVVAATCVAREHSAASVVALERWVASRPMLGLALAVLNELDAMDEATATRVADRALAGENAAEARGRIERATRFPSLVERARRATVAP